MFINYSIFREVWDCQFFLAGMTFVIPIWELAWNHVESLSSTSPFPPSQFLPGYNTSLYLSMRELDINDGSPQSFYCDSLWSATSVEDNLKVQKPCLEDLESGSRRDVSSGQSDGMCLYLSSVFNSCCVISSRHWICKYRCSCNQRTWMHKKGRGQPKRTWTRQKKMQQRESQEARCANHLEVKAKVNIKIKASCWPRRQQWQHQQLVVFESPVWSGFFMPKVFKHNCNRSAFSPDVKRPDWTTKRLQTAVFCSL